MSVQSVALTHKKELLELLEAACATGQGPFEIIGRYLETDECPRIDLIGRDPSGRLLLIQVDVAPDRQAPLKAAAQLAWVRANRMILPRLFDDFETDESAPPGAALIYPEFPLLVKSFIRAAPSSFTLLLYRYRCFDAGNERFLHLEKVALERPSAPLGDTAEADLPPFRVGMAGDVVSLSGEERDAFLS